MTDVPLPVAVGRTENALAALLTHTLRGTAVHDPHGWAYLNVAATGTAHAQIADRLGLDPQELARTETSLVDHGLLTAPGALSARGHDALAAARPLVAARTARLCEGIAEEHQRIARQVLDALRANALSQLPQP